MKFYRHKTMLAFITRIAAASVMMASCAAFKDPASPTDARLKVTSRAPAAAILTPGKHNLGLGGGRDGFIYVPASAAGNAPMPMLLMLHGAGRQATEFDKLLPYAEQLGFVILAPDSREFTWDLATGFGPDINFISKAMNYAYDHLHIDAARVAVAGFSDGASYALTLGLANGDIFERVIAYSPGYYVVTTPIGKPPVFVAHGEQDTVLPFEYTRVMIVQHLETTGYTVKFVPFEGPHAIDDSVAYQSFDWWLSRR